MSSLSRRTALLGGATLASVLLPRKPWAQPILAPKAESAPHLGGMKALVATSPSVLIEPAAFQDADGKPMSLADFRGKGVVLNLWATWCVPCVAEMPALDALATKLAGQNIVVLPLSSDRGGANLVQRFYASHDIAHLGTWIDPFGKTAKSLGARGLPTTVLIDRQGREVARLEGGADWATDEATATITRLLSV
jgi:thiol-disulfide isomerase/thioredoxin